MGVANVQRMMPDSATETKPNDTDAEKLARLLEIELIQKRGEWKQASARRRNMRSLAFAFIFCVVIASLFGAYFVFMRVNEERGNQHQHSNTAPAQH
ncbi:MAG TPA: hypothetical protein VIW21_07985 [Chthoniobacterales bacterium]|jgi:hypothetical protein